MSISGGLRLTNNGALNLSSTDVVPKVVELFGGDGQPAEFTFPSTSGSANQLLIQDGNAGTTWDTPNSSRGTTT